MLISRRPTTRRKGRCGFLGTAAHHEGDYSLAPNPHDEVHLVVQTQHNRHARILFGRHNTFNSDEYQDADSSRCAAMSSGSGILFAKTVQLRYLVIG